MQIHNKERCVMIYSNVNVKSEEIKFDFGVIHQIQVGERGRGRQLIALTCPPNVEIVKGMNPDYTIGTTKSGKPRVNRGRDRTLYLLLSSHGGYTRRGNGIIYIPRARYMEYKVLALGNGADGAAGNVGRWKCALLTCTAATGFVKVVYSGYQYGIEPEYFVIHKGRAYCCKPTELEDCCEHLGVDSPDEDEDWKIVW